MSARYFIGPTAALEDRELSATDFRVLCTLGSFLGKEGEQAWPKQETIADRAGVHRVTANKSLKKLRSRGFVVARERSSGAKKALSYRVILDPELNMDAAESPISSDVAKSYNDVAKDYNDVAPGDYNDVATATTSKEDTHLEDTQSLGADAPDDLFPDSQPSPLPSKPATADDACRQIVFSQGLNLLVCQGLKENSARGFLGKLIKQFGSKQVAGAVTAALAEEPGDAKAWIMAALKTRAPRQDISRSVDVDAERAALIRRFKRFAETGRWQPAFGPQPYLGDYDDEIYRAAGLPTPDEKSAA